MHNRGAVRVLDLDRLKSTMAKSVAVQRLPLRTRRPPAAAMRASGLERFRRKVREDGDV